MTRQLAYVQDYETYAHPAVNLLVFSENIFEFDGAALWPIFEILLRLRMILLLRRLVNK